MVEQYRQRNRPIPFHLSDDGSAPGPGGVSIGIQQTGFPRVHGVQSSSISDGPRILPNQSIDHLGLFSIVGYAAGNSNFPSGKSGQTIIRLRQSSKPIRPARGANRETSAVEVFSREAQSWSYDSVGRHESHRQDFLIENVSKTITVRNRNRCRRHVRRRTAAEKMG
jgi:hypothetical protein